MSLPPFEIHRPASMRKACRLLNELGGNARPLAGGTDLFLDLQDGTKKVNAAVSLASIPGLDTIQMKEGAVVIGALATPNAIAANPIVQAKIPALAEAARSMAAVQVRNLATIGGNIANAVPSADLPPTLIAAEGFVTAVGEKGRRKIALERLFSGPRETVLRHDEIISAVVVPKLPSRTGISYEKFVRRGANVVAVAAVAARLTLSRGKIQTARLVLGAVAPVPLLAKEAAAVLLNKKPDEDLFSLAAAIAAREAKPISDVRASRAYRKDLVETLTRRALSSALARAQA